MSFRFSVAKYFSKPKLVRAKPLLTIEQIVVKVRPETRVKAKKVRSLDITEVKPVSILPGYSVYRVVTQNQENGHRYKVTVFSPTRKITKSTKIVIDDPCPVFIYKFEYAMAKRGNAFLYRSNGEPPIVTNPKLRPGLSHHGVRAIIDLIKYTKSFKEKPKTGLRAGARS